MILAATAGAWLAGTSAGRAQQPPAAPFQPLNEGQRFDPAGVVELARQASRRPFAPPPNDLPEVFARLNYDQYVAIKAQAGTAVWAGEGRGYTVEPLHRGFVFSNPVALFTVEDGTIRRLTYDRARFDFGRVEVPAAIGDIGYSGFRLQSSFGNGQLGDFAIFQGATFFRAIARGQSFGAVSRALTLRPAEARGEEFPLFRAFWIERPMPGTGTLVLHALADSDSCAAAMRMTLRAGELSIVDVEMTVFPRAPLDHVGFGGMGSTYLFGAADRRGVDDVRPAVHESTGLQMLAGSGEWIYRPLQNPETLQISAFLDRNPAGFGLVQRDRDVAAFQDDDQSYERRPTLWVQPLGEWGQGAVQLIEIPSDSEVNDNILAYWRPRGAIAAGGELAVAYRQFWGWAPPERPPLAVAAQTRVGRGSAGRRRRFLVDFTGDNLAAAIPELRAQPSTTPGAIHQVRLWPVPARKLLRVAFELDPGGDNACEMRLVLEAQGKPVSETWLYRWTP